MSTANPALSTANEPLQLFPVGIETLDEHLLQMDLYLRPDPHGPPVLYRSVGLKFTADDQTRLAEQGVKFVYVPVRQHAAYRRAMLDRLNRMFRDSEASRQERIRAVRSACAKMIEDVLLFPGQPEAVDSVADISREFAAWSAENNSAFSYLLDMSAHDYYTVTHMVNVGVGCGLLSEALRPGDRDLQSQLIEGGMLHDLGKRGVPERLLNKEGRLEPREWEVIRRHPGIGHRELSGHPSVPPAVLEMVRDHHERPDGQGYPAGLAGTSLSLAARICAVVDSYDAICAARPYRAATAPQDALEIMREGSGTQFDQDILWAWSELVQELVREDPERAVPPSEGGRIGSLDELLPRAPGDDADYDGRPGYSNWAKERRRHIRVPCRTSVRVQVVRLGKRLPVEPGQWVALETVDISRGGIQLLTPWPMSLNDVLRIELPLGQKPRRVRLAQVVRIRKASEDRWVAGLCFIAGDAAAE